MAVKIDTMGRNVTPEKVAEITKAYQKLANENEAEVEATTRDDDGKITLKIRATPDND